MSDLTKLLAQVYRRVLVELYTRLPTEYEVAVFDNQLVQISRWETLEDGPNWVLTVEVPTHGGRVWHPGETIDTISIPNGNHLHGGQLVGAHTNPDSQTLVIKGHGVTYDPSPSETA